MSLSNLFNQKEKYNQPSTRNPDTPAGRAEATWDRRAGRLAVQAYNWRRIAVGLIVVCIVLAGGLVFQSMKSRVVPYVVTVDKSTGEIERAGAFTNSDYTPGEAEIKYFLAQFVKNARSIGYDPVAYGNMQDTAAHFLTQTAMQKYVSTMEKDLQDKVGKYTVSVKNISVQKVPESDSSYLLRWTEEVVRINSSEYQDIPMSGTFSYARLPVQDKDLLINPLGIYITGFDFTQDATAVNAADTRRINAGNTSASATSNTATNTATATNTTNNAAAGADNNNNN